MAKSKSGSAKRAPVVATSPNYDEVAPVREAGGVLHSGLTILEVSDPSDLTSLLADPRLAGLVVARIGSNAAAVLPKAVPRLLKALLKAGHTPTVIGGP